LVEVVYRLLTFLRLDVSIGIAPIPRGWRLMTASLLLGRIGRNPKSGEPVSLSAKYVPHFKPGKDLRERVNEGQRSQDKELLLQG